MQEGLYRVDVLESKETEFRVYSGSVEAAAEEGSVMVRDGEQVTAANGRFNSSPGSLSSRRDDFNDWNASRDAIFARRLTKTYLPADYSDYEYELSSYGRWAYEAPYGNVWVPTISDYDWRPYYNGRWVWYPIIGWTWVSYEPWGWCTSHYGRWGWRFGLGWYWIPQNHWGWGPAWVHWYHGNDHYGWCALSYYDRPAVILNNHFYDRYDRDYFPGNSRSLVVVNRNQLQSPRLREAALNQRAVERLGRFQLQASQPNIRPALSRDNAVNSGALKAFSRENLRDVGKGFVSGQRRLDPQAIRPSVQNRIRGSGASSATGASPSKAVNNKDLEKFNEERGIRRQDLNQSSQRNEEGVSSGTIRSRTDIRGSSKPIAENEMKREIRSFPSSGSQVRSGDLSPSRAKEFSAPKIEERGSRSAPSIRESQDRSTIRSYPSRKSEGEASSPSSSFRSSGARDERKIEERAITSRSERRESSLNPSESRSFREYQPRSSGSSSSRDDSMGRMIRERSSSTEAPPVQSPPRSTIKERGSSERGSSTKDYFSNYESRSSSSSRSYSSPSRNSSSPSSPSYSAPSRSYSNPSRSYSPPTRSYNSPSSPSYSAPSRSYSSPSRSSSGPSRSFSAPSRSSSSGSSSRSSSGVSRSSSSRSTSSSSSSSGRVRRK